VICGIVQDEGYFAHAVEPHVDGIRSSSSARSARGAAGKSSAMRLRCCTRLVLSPSERHRARYCPCTFRGNNAMPLFRAAGSAVRGRLVEVPWSRCGRGG
jgi:hypothetical protein